MTSTNNVVTLGAQVGGKEAHDATNAAILALRRRLAAVSRGPYSPVFDEFALILRIDGAIDHWDRSGVDYVRLQKKLRYAKADIFVPKSAWAPTSPIPFTQYLATHVEVAIRTIADRAAKSKVPVDSERLLADVKRATAEFLAGVPG